VTQVSGGWKHALALTADGKVWAWGDNSNGENRKWSDFNHGRPPPISGSGLSNIISVSAGDGYSAALKDDGTVWTWGYNSFRQLGDGSTTDKSSPEQVPGVSNVVFLAAKDYHTMVITSDARCWLGVPARMANWEQWYFRHGYPGPGYLRRKPG